VKAFAALAAALTIALSRAFAADGAKVFELVLAEGKVAGNNTLRVKRGERVELRWSGDRSTVLHLHGYDVECAVSPGAPAAMVFKADLAGRFPVSEHRHGPGHHRALLYLEVHP